MNPTPIKSHKDLEARIRSYQQGIKSAAAEPTDPTNKGTVAVPTLTEGKDQLSSQKPNGPGVVDTAQLSGTPASPPANETGKDQPPAPKDGNATEKVAGAVERVISLLNKSASAPAAPAAAASAGTAPAAAPAPAPATAPATSKAASEETLVFTPAMMLKLASVMLSTEEGIRDAERHMLKSAGREEAGKLIKAASAEFQQLQQAMAMEELEKQAAVEYVQSGAAELEEFLKSASVEERQDITKMAKVLGHLIDQIQHPLEKQAFMQGAMEGAALDDAAPAEGGEPDGDEATLPGAGEGEQLSPEQIVQILDGLVQSGQIDQETAAAVLQAVMGGEGAPAEGGAGAEAPVDADPEVSESVAKAASAIADLVYEKPAPAAPAAPAPAK